MELLTIRETARKYNLSETMLRQMEREGRLPGVYTGEQKRVKSRSLRLGSGGALGCIAPNGLRASEPR